ncbi:hypothetical protein J4217_02360 [Candidatus Pacearchaeota archaeon]|nr:hypothetical protein [Candidatus Pacearchaeota archaeon]
MVSYEASNNVQLNYFYLLIFISCLALSPRQGLGVLGRVNNILIYSDILLTIRFNIM